MVKISIVMPVYNGADVLEKSIESVSRQTLMDLELICVDDGSTDNSLDVLNEFKRLYPFIKVIHQENQGSGKARNNGIENAAGEYIAFLDADDIFIDENALEEMYNYGKETDANIVCANLKFLDLDWNIKDNPHYEAGDYARFDEYGKTSPKDYGIPYAFYKNIYKKEYINEYNLRFPDLLRGQDPIFMANSLINTPEIYTTPFDLYGYNHDIGGGVNKKINTYEKKRDYIQHFKDTSDILAEGGFQETSDFFKIHMFRYLTFEDNNADPDVFELFNEIFGIDNETFDESDFNYVRFIVPAYFYFLKKYDSQEFYLRTNKKFLTMNIYDTFLITEEIVNKYLFVVYSYSYDDFKSNCDKYLSNNLKFKDEFMKFKVEKFLFNLEITFSPVVFENTKMILENNPVFKNKLIYKNSLKKCFMVLSYDTVEEYKENL